MGSLGKSDNHNSQGLSALTGWVPYWYGSGTMALAVAVKAACVNVKSGNPKVVLAAYGCPDLVAAIRFAGATPHYVDLEIDRLNMDPVQLRRVLEEDRDICAIIGSDLFGVSENWEVLKSSCPEPRPVLIQDCAQSLQSKLAFRDNLHGDVVVFSFGRGKPLCLLGGGALLVADSVPCDIANALQLANHGTDESRVRFSKFKMAFYNFLINPRLYSLLAMVMGKRLGEIRYIPLLSVERMSMITASDVDAAVEWFWSNHADNFAALFTALLPILQDFGDEISTLIPTETEKEGERIFLRMPLLIRSPEMRDELIRELIANGISATTMYKRVLPDIVGPQDVPVKKDDHPVARHLADRLVTLPVHSRLSRRDIKLISKVFRNYFRPSASCEVAGT